LKGHGAETTEHFSDAENNVKIVDPTWSWSWVGGYVVRSTIKTMRWKRRTQGGPRGEEDIQKGVGGWSI